jgi:uncharacterized membrane protein YesL
MKKESGYIPCMKQWIHYIIYEPVSWIKMSLWFLLWSLPVLTIGCGWTFILFIAHEEVLGNKAKGTNIFSIFIHSNALVKSFIMGIIDILLILALFLSSKYIGNPESPMLLRFISALFLWLDILLFLSSLYRYPLLVDEPNLTFIQLYSDAILFCFTNLKLTLLISMALISIVIFSVLIGITLFMFLPGGMALLVIITFQQSKQ